MIEVVTVDGPAASGKSTVAKLLADRLKYSYLDTGAMYRAFALTALKAGADEDESKIGAVLAAFEISFVNSTGSKSQTVLVNDEDVTDEIRLPEVSQWSSAFSRNPEVRAKMGALQRSIGELGRYVAEGRDMGTVVFKDAFVKFFMRASLDVRAVRRFNELTQRGVDVDIEKVKIEMKMRDEQDSNRDIAPLKPAEDALVIDSSEMTIDAVVEMMHGMVEERHIIWRS